MLKAVIWFLVAVAIAYTLVDPVGTAGIILAILQWFIDFASALRSLRENGGVG